MSNATQIRKSVETAAKAYAEHVSEGYSRTFGAAKATHEATEAGLLGGDSPVWSSVDYLAMFHVGAKSTSLLVRWRLLGKVIGLGCKDRSTLWLDMVEGNAIDAKIVKDAIRAEKATLAKITTAVRKAKAEAARAEKARTRGARPNGNAPAPANGQTDQGQDNYAKAVAAVAALSDLVKSLDREQWATVETRMGEIVTRENRLRTKAAAEATAKATKAAARTAAKAPVEPVAAAS